MKKIYRYFIKTLLCVIIFLILAIFCKKNFQLKQIIYHQIYNESISFSNFRQFYNRYLGGIFPIENISSLKINEVFDEKLNYSSAKSYEEGVRLFVSQNYLVPNLYGGIVVYIGEKEKYNHVVIVENDEGIDTWYGNLCNISVKLYDNIEDGTYLGEACDDFIYLVYTKGNEFLDYQDYLS